MASSRRLAMRARMPPLAFTLAATTLAYLIAGTVQIFGASGINLVHAAIFSSRHSVDRRMVPMPWAGAIARWRIENMPSKRFDDLFSRRWKANSYGVFEIARSYGETDNAATQAATEMSDLLRRRGLSDFALDSIGCSSGHRATMPGLDSLRKYLVAQGLSGTWPANPMASVAACRKEVFLTSGT